MEFVVGYGGQDITLQTKGCTYIGIELIGFDCYVVLPYVSLAGSFKNNNKIFKTAISEWNSRNLRILPTLEIFLIIRKGSMLPLFMYIFTIYPQSTTLSDNTHKISQFYFPFSFPNFGCICQTMTDMWWLFSNFGIYIWFRPENFELQKKPERIKRSGLE